MQGEHWLEILLLSFCLVSVVNSLLACCTAVYYRRTSSGRLSHSQLRIKQGTATFEHRVNVFAQNLSISFFSLRVYIFTALTWLAIHGLLYIFASF